MNPPQVYMCSPILTPPPSSLPIPSLWVVPVHQPQASSIVHRTWTGNSFHTWYFKTFNAILPNLPTLSLSHRVHKTTSGWPVLPAPLVKEIVFSPLYILASLVKDKVSIGAWIYLFLFCSIGLYFCLCANTILSWWLWLCSRAWSQAGLFLQFHSSLSRLLWLFKRCTLMK